MTAEALQPSNSPCTTSTPSNLARAPQLPGAAGEVRELKVAWRKFDSVRRQQGIEMLNRMLISLGPVVATAAIAGSVHAQTTSDRVLSIDQLLSIDATGFCSRHLVDLQKLADALRPEAIPHLQIL